MKKFAGTWAIMMMVATSLFAWDYYQSGYDSYPSDSWQYPNSYSYPQESTPTTYQKFFPRNETTGHPHPTHFTQPTTQPTKSFEQQYGNLIVMFTKDSCPYCQYMKPIIQQMENKFGQHIKFLYVDVAQQPNHASQYGFSTVPHIVYFKDGQKLDAHGSGNKTMKAHEVESKIRTYFADVLTDK